MPLKIDDDPKFWNDVHVRLGIAEPETFKALFRVRGVDDFNEVVKSADPEAVTTFLADTVVGLADVEDEAGEKLSFSPTLLGRMIKRPDIRNALLKSYTHGVIGAAQGN